MSVSAQSLELLRTVPPVAFWLAVVVVVVYFSVLVLANKFPRVFARVESLLYTPLLYMNPKEWRRFGWGIVAAMIAYMAGWLHAFVQVATGLVVWPFALILFGSVAAFAFWLALKGGA